MIFSAPVGSRNKVNTRCEPWEQFETGPKRRRDGSVSAEGTRASAASHIRAAAAGPSVRSVSAILIDRFTTLNAADSPRLKRAPCPSTYQLRYASDTTRASTLTRSGASSRQLQDSEPYYYNACVRPTQPSVPSGSLTRGHS